MPSRRVDNKDPVDVAAWLSEYREQIDDNDQERFLQFEDLWERKQWHELTVSLLEYFNLNSGNGQELLVVWNNFVKQFATKINAVSLVTLAVYTAMQFEEVQPRVNFFQEVSKIVNTPKTKDAYVYARAELAYAYRNIGDIAKARETLDECEQILSTSDGFPTIVYASYYESNANYYRKHIFPGQEEDDYSPETEHTLFYRNTLLYLSCLDPDEYEIHLKHESLAYDLAVSGLLSDGIYSYGELLLHPIMNDLKERPGNWLNMYELVVAFNNGDLAGFDRLADTIKKDPELRKKERFLRQKIALCALTGMIFRRSPTDRVVNFDDIARDTRVTPGDVEELVMRALSLGLLKGTIDQVARVARIVWVQPKALDMEQIDTMRLRLQDWDSNVNQLGTWIEKVGKEVWAA